MQAVVLGEFGGPEVLRIHSVADPASEPGWVTVRLKAAALNWHDVLVRQGKYSSPLPHILGADGANRPLVRYEQPDNIAVITLDHPETRNPLSDEMLDQLIGAFQRAAAAAPVRVVVLEAALADNRLSVVAGAGLQPPRSRSTRCR